MKKRAFLLLGLVLMGTAGMYAQSLFVTTEREAKSGNKVSQFNLGLYYADGIGVDQDSAKAIYWWRKAASQNNRIAQCNIGLCYAEGTGVAQDDKQAVQWYRKSAEQGYADACYDLGRAYWLGKGVPQDDKQAEYWLRLAAEKGYDMAWRILSEMGVIEGVWGTSAELADPEPIKERK